MPYSKRDKTAHLQGKYGKEIWQKQRKTGGWVCRTDKLTIITGTYLKPAQKKIKSKKQMHNAVKNQLGYLRINIKSVNQEAKTGKIRL